MNLVITFLLAVLGLFAAMLALMETGWRIGVYRKKRDAKGAHSGLGAIEGAVYGLMGLLVAFTFSGAASRFDARRELIGHETNDIGTAYLRVDLLPPDLQPAIREDFRNYVDARLAYYRNVGENLVGICCGLPESQRSGDNVACPLFCEQHDRRNHDAGCGI